MFSPLRGQVSAITHNFRAGNLYEFQNMFHFYYKD